MKGIMWKRQANRAQWGPDEKPADNWSKKMKSRVNSSDPKSRKGTCGKRIRSMLQL
jgi:hypothetical protein